MDQLIFLRISDVSDVFCLLETLRVAAKGAFRSMLNSVAVPVTGSFRMRYPPLRFVGRILYSRTALEAEKAAAKLLQILQAKKKQRGQVAIGFDIEWRPTFRKGWFSNFPWFSPLSVWNISSFICFFFLGVNSAC